MFVTLMICVIASFFIACGGAPAPNNTVVKPANAVTTPANAAVSVNTSTPINSISANTAKSNTANLKTTPIGVQKLPNNAKVDAMAADEPPQPEAKKKR